MTDKLNPLNGCTTCEILYYKWDARHDMVLTYISKAILLILNFTPVPFQTTNYEGDRYLQYQEIFRNGNTVLYWEILGNVGVSYRIF